MNELEALAPAARVALRHKLAAWSDQREPHAVQLVEQSHDLLPKRITNAQLSGLENIVGQAPTYREIRAFLDNQATRANKGGRLDVAGYWNALAEVLSMLRREAEQLWSEVAPADLADRQRRAAIDELHVRLVREYVQHLVAHSLYLAGLSQPDR
ncbi:MAG: hypothetical protein M5U01_41920 [Ardenticatenaceae bacterium]|nr:hypothetical protein [Ardenticatenaceae bacterium]